MTSPAWRGSGPAVSRVTTRQDCVRATTRARIQLAIGEPGYGPGGAAQSRSRRRKEVIGFVCVDCPGQPLEVENTNLIYPDEVLRGVERRISGLGWSVLVT